MEFKGTKGKWRYVKPTEKFDACTISENGKVVGYTVKNSIEDRANELLRSKAPEMLDMLNKVLEYSFENAPHLREQVKQLIKEATEL